MNFKSAAILRPSDSDDDLAENGEKSNAEKLMEDQMFMLTVTRGCPITKFFVCDKFKQNYDDS